MGDIHSFVSGTRAEMLDALRNTQFKLGSDGFVRFVDYMGDDSAVVQAARVSYGAGTKSVSDDRALIRYLMRHRHTTPFEMCELKLHVRVPMDTWRQWIRHRTASVNEYSTRYSEAIDASNRVDHDQWRAQSSSNKQGSSGAIQGFPEGYEKHVLGNELIVTPPGVCPDEVVYGVNPAGDPTLYTAGQYLTDQQDRLMDISRFMYDERLKFGVAREQARKDLPLSTYTEAYWKIDLHNLIHFLGLRMDSHAQQEIREYATVIGEEIVKRVWPVTWEAFEDYMLHSMTLSSMEVQMLQQIITTMRTEIQSLENDAGMKISTGSPSLEDIVLPDDWRDKQRCRERDEFMAKMKTLDVYPED